MHPTTATTAALRCAAVSFLTTERHQMRLPKSLTLTLRKDGRWSKKIDGSIHYFGRGSEEEARRRLIEFLAGVPDGLATVTETQSVGGGHGSTRDVVNAWLERRSEDVQAGRLHPRTLYEYRSIARLLLKLNLDDRPDLADDVKSAISVGSPEVTKKRCVIAQTLLRAAGINIRIPKPGKAEIRRHRASSPRKIISAREFEVLLSAACPTMRAALLLGLNCGFHSVDAARLEWTHIEGSVLDHPRQKTGIARQCPLWPETLAALRDADFGLPGSILRTRRGNPLIVDHESGSRTNVFSKRFRRLRSRSGIAKPVTYCWLRSTFRTIVDHHPDLSAVRRIMGHEVGDGAESAYIQEVGVDRLRLVTDIVRDWLRW